MKGKKQVADSDIALQLVNLYHAPELCNYHCNCKCEIGQKYIPKVDVKDLLSIILKTVTTLNDIQPLVNRLNQITMDNQTSDDEIFTASDVLRLWVKKNIHANKLNSSLYYDKVKKLKNNGHIKRQIIQYLNNLSFTLQLSFLFNLA